MKRRVRRLVTVVAALGAMFSAASMPASASTARRSCAFCVSSCPGYFETGYLCMKNCTTAATTGQCMGSGPDYGCPVGQELFHCGETNEQ